MSNDYYTTVDVYQLQLLKVLEKLGLIEGLIFAPEFMEDGKVNVYVKMK